jgi:nucleotide-binding universal stress UspA family protein
MDKDKNILLCVDNSDSSIRTVAYVANMVSENKEGLIWLFHVLQPMPPQLMEFGGSENAQEEERLDERQEEARAKWISQAEQDAEAGFLRAKAVLAKGKIPSESIETQILCCSGDEDLAEVFIKEARAKDCGTIVVGRRSFSWLDRIFSHHVADKLIPKSEGLTIWVVE